MGRCPPPDHRMGQGVAALGAGTEFTTWTYDAPNAGGLGALSKAALGEVFTPPGPADRRCVVLDLLPADAREAALAFFSTLTSLCLSRVDGGCWWKLQATSARTATG